MQTRFLLAICTLALGIQIAHADIILPDVNAKYVSIKQENPDRDAGYVVGDVLERTITLTIKKPYELVKESLPIEGYEHRYRGQISGIELIKINTQETSHSDSVTHVLRLKYQVFTTGKLAKPAALRAEIIKLRNTANKEIVQYRIPSFNFRISPLSVFGSVKLKEEMSPFVRPLRLNANRDILQLEIAVGLLSLTLIALLYIFGAYAWLPRMGAPFAKAYRDIRKMPNTTEELKKAVARLHTALNNTAGSILFSSNLADFLQKKPAFTPLEAEFEKFFTLSSEVFFESSEATHLGENSKDWLLKFCRHLRDCERGLTPNIPSKVSR